MLYKLLSILILFSIALKTFAQKNIHNVNIPGEWITSKEGLSQGFVSSIIQDDEGYMWFATKDGLNKYDGYHITVLRNSPGDKFSLPDNFVTQLLQDDNGNFWVGTATKGLCLFDKKTERFYPVKTGTNKDTLENDAIRFLRLNHGKLFIQKSSDVLIYDISNLKPVDYTSIGNNQMKLLFSYNDEQQTATYKYNITRQFSFSWMPDFSIWVNCFDTVFHYMPDATLQHWTRQDWSLHDFGIHEVPKPLLLFAPYQHHPEKIFVGYRSKLMLYDILKKKADFTKQLSQTYKSGDIKMETLSDGSIFFYFNSDTPYIYNPATNIISSVIVNKGQEKMQYAFAPVYKDKNNISWFGTAGYGILKSDGLRQRFNSFKTIDNREALNYINGQYEAMIDSSFTGKYNFNYDDICIDKKGNLWIMAMQKNNFRNAVIYCINPGTKQIITYPFFHTYDIFRWSLFCDNANTLWVFTDEGPSQKMLYHLDENQKIIGGPYRLPINNDFNEYTFVSQWWQDKRGNLWLGTLQGLFRFNPVKQQWQQWKNIPNDSNSLSADMIFTLCADPHNPDKYLWIGTNGGGFCRFEFATGKWQRYSDEDGLANNVVYGILSDSTGNLWLSTNKGLSCFNIQNKSFRNFTEDDGLAGDEFNRYQFMKMKNGDLMFGGVNGFSIFNPKNILDKQTEVPVVFTGLSIFNKTVNWKTDTTVIAAPIGYAKSITLQPGQNMFTISFASLEYRNNQKKFYKYKLDGFNDNWTTPVNKNEATFTNLSPGTYTLHVTGTNSDGVWNQKGISIEIIVLPYWYQTWWFIVAIALLIIVILYNLYRYRLNQVLKIEKLRNRIASDLHDEIGSTLSSISLYGESAKMMIKENDPAHEILSKISASTSEMMEAMSDIVWAINTRNDNIDNLANRMRSFAVQITEAKNIQLQFADNKDLPPIPLNMVQRKNIYLIFKEAVNNAVKYSQCKSLWISFANEPDTLRMIIKDDGEGFDMQNPVKNKQGGNGIINMKNRAEQINGNLLITSGGGEGTVVILNVQLKKS